MVELFKHYPKIMKLAKQEEERVIENIYTCVKGVIFVNETQIDPKTWLEAKQLTQDVDFKDIAHVALSLHLEGKLWTSDKKLIKGLEEKGFSQILTTSDIKTLIT